MGSSSGSIQCIPVYIIDDTEPEASEEFILTLFASDVAVAVAQEGETTTVVIQDNEGSYKATPISLILYVVYNQKIPSLFWWHCFLPNAEFFIQFINNTPDVEGNEVTISFNSSMPLVSATCQTRPRPDQNCKHMDTSLHTI